MNKELMTGHLYRVKAQDYPDNVTQKTMYYATACDRDTEGIDQLLDRIQLAGTRRTEVKWAWNLLLDAVQMSLEAGHPVCLDGLARISLTCTSPLCTHPDDVTPDLVRTKRVIMRPVRRFCEGMDAVKYIDVCQL